MACCGFGVDPAELAVLLYLHNASVIASSLKNMLAAIKIGARMKELARDFPTGQGRYVSWCKEMIREYKKQPTKARHTHKACCKMIGKKTIPFEHPDWQQSAVVIGNPGIGKTQWALSHFNDGKGALLVTEMDDLLAYSEGEFDGIVFDDMSFKTLDVSKQKHLLDWDQERTIRCRYSDAVIPAHTKKIFTCNWDAWPFNHSDDAIDERIYNIETDRNKGTKRGRAPQLEDYEDKMRFGI